jgi:hypothetical protein
MLIETSTKNDIFFAVSCFVLIIVITTCAGIFVPPLTQEASSRLSLTTDTKGNVISLRIPGVTPQNQFLSVFFTFELSNPLLTESEERVTISYVVLFYSANTEVRREKGTFSKMVRFLPRTDSSIPCEFFYDRFLLYDHVDVRLQVLDYKLITDVVLAWTTGEPKHLQFQAWIRGAFGIASCAALFVYFQRLSFNSVRTITIEQKLTFILAIIAIIGVNPLFVFYSIEPTLLQDILNAFLFVCLHRLLFCSF